MIREMAAKDTDSDASGNGQYKRRPGPLNGDQLRECNDMTETVRTWIEEKARDWGVGQGSIARALGLQNTERRQPHWWNKHQSRFYTMNVRREGGKSFI